MPLPPIRMMTRLYVNSAARLLVVAITLISQALVGGERHITKFMYWLRLTERLQEDKIGRKLTKFAKRTFGFAAVAKKNKAVYPSPTMMDPG